MTAAFLAMQAAALAGAPPVTSGNWLIVCDYRAQCHALSQVPAGGDPTLYPLAVLRRTDDATVLDLPINATIAPGTRIPLMIDGKIVAELVAPGRAAGLSLPFEGKLAAAIRRGRMLTIGAGEHLRRVSLTGVTAAADAIAHAPQRPAPPPATIEATAPDPRAPRLPSRKMLEKLASAPDKRCRPFVTRAERLDAQHSLLALDSPCTGSRPYVLPDKGDAQPAIFDDGVPTGGAWDAAQRRYTAILPPVGASGCGTRRAFAWDGARFRLAEERLVAECRRATYEVVTYRAAVHQR